MLLKYRVAVVCPFSFTKSIVLGLSFILLLGQHSELNLTAHNSGSFLPRRHIFLDFCCPHNQWYTCFIHMSCLVLPATSRCAMYIPDVFAVRRIATEKPLHVMEFLRSRAAPGLFSVSQMLAVCCFHPPFFLCTYNIFQRFCDDFVTCFAAQRHGKLVYSASPATSTSLMRALARDVVAAFGERCTLLPRSLLTYPLSKFYAVPL
jgi:hypothetical protein